MGELISAHGASPKYAVYGLKRSDNCHGCTEEGHEKEHDFYDEVTDLPRCEKQHVHTAAAPEEHHHEIALDHPPGFADDKVLRSHLPIRDRPTPDPSHE